MASKPFILPPLHCLTDAPIDYDYSWQIEVNPEWGKTDRGRTVRLCRNEDHWHLRQQVLRYGSGLHFGLTKQSEVDAQIRHGFIIPNDHPA